MEIIDSILDGTLTSSATFFVIGALGLALLILATILDGIFDGLSLGDGPISLVSISAFMAMFGFSAFVAVYSGADMTWAIIIGSLVGLIGGVAAWYAMRFFKRSESSVSYSVQTLAGLEAVVSLEIRPGKTGEISVNHLGINNYLAAIADDTELIKAGTRVRIESLIGSDKAKVTVINTVTPVIEKAE